MKNIQKLLVFAVVVWLTHSVNVLSKVLLDDPAALCLDGTPGAYYIDRGDRTRFLLSFESGGWCGSPNSVAATI